VIYGLEDVKNMLADKETIDVFFCAIQKLCYELPKPNFELPVH
jgi:hypothetical protein